MFSFTILPREVAGFAVVLFRIAGIMGFAPFFNSSAIPAQVKVLIPLTVALMLAPVAPQAAAAADFTLVRLVVSLAGEFLIGMVLGLVASFLFAGIQLAGQIAGFQLGFSIINVIDPQTEVQTSVISVLYNFVGLVFFLLVDGHHWFLLAVSRSFDYLPVGGVHLQGPLVEGVLRMSSQIFVSGLQMAGPVVVATVVADVIMGIIGRAAPQINILIVGMPIKTLVGLGCMSLAFYFMPELLGRYLVELSRVLLNILPALS
jgi:flagellar biosynthetic protein FliR